MSAREIETRQLRQVEALARLGSFAAASRELGLSQPALTRSIQRLERNAGGALFRRHARGVNMTPLGVHFLQRARQVLAELADLGRELDLARTGNRAVLHIGVGPTVRGSAVPKALRRLWRDQPTIRVHITRASVLELTRQLLDRSIDLLLGDRVECETDRRFEVMPLRGEKQVWVAHPGHPLAAGLAAGRRALGVTQLDGHPIALPRLAALFPRGAPPRVRAWKPSGVECEDPELLIQLALQGTAVALLPRSAVQGELRRGSLVALNIAPEMPRTRPAAVWIRGRALSRVAEAFVSRLPREA